MHTDSLTRWPEQSAVYYLWAAAEDIVMTAWLHFALQHQPRHLSLHYDGMRVELPQGVTAADFSEQCSKHILALTLKQPATRVAWVETCYWHRCLGRMTSEVIKTHVG